MTADPTPNNERRWVCVHSETSQPCAEVIAHVGCGYDDAAPVPSPVPSRPDTARGRQWATDDWNNGQMDTELLAYWIGLCDWIDAQPAADQGPDLSDLRVLADSWKQRGITASTVFGSFSAASVYDECASDLRRLLDREGGTQ